MNDRIEELKSRIAVLRSELEPLEEELRGLLDKQIENASPIKPGDLIEWKYGGRNERLQRGKVSNVIKGWTNGTFHYRVRVVRKDGSDGRNYLVRSYLNPRKVE